MRGIIAGLATLTLLAGCAATIPFQGEGSRDRIAKDLAVSPDSIVREDRCLVGRYAGIQSAEAFECIYIATATYAALLDYDTKANRFVEALRIVPGKDKIALVDRNGLINLVQMQVRHGQDIYAVEFVTNDYGQLGHQDDLRAAYAHLRSIGVDEAVAMPYVNRRAKPTPMVIPIYIPR